MEYLNRLISNWHYAISSQIRCSIERLAEHTLQADELSIFWRAIKG